MKRMGTKIAWSMLLLAALGLMITGQSCGGTFPITDSGDAGNDTSGGNTGTDDGTGSETTDGGSGSGSDDAGDTANDSNDGSNDTSDGDNGDNSSGGDTSGQNDEMVGESNEVISVMKSTDGGDTWTYLGAADFGEHELLPVDPDPIYIQDKIVLYFFDLQSSRPSSPESTETPVRAMYRATSDDGVNFDSPVKVYSTATNLVTDPCVVVLEDGTYRMYMAEGSNVLSASSSDGLSFTDESGVRCEHGGIPGVVRLDDGRYRLFGPTLGGIGSFISEDGLSFTFEPDPRIEGWGLDIGDPDPLRLQDGSYIMVFKVLEEGTTPFDDEVWLATSEDGDTWTVKEELGAIDYGSVPGIVQAGDGSLYAYFVDFHTGED